METLLAKNELLRKFAVGILTESEMEAVLAYLAEDEAAVEALESLWQGDEESFPGRPTLDRQNAKQLEKCILSRLNRGYFATNMLALGSKGFLAAASGLLRPFFKMS